MLSVLDGIVKLSYYQLNKTKASRAMQSTEATQIALLIIGLLAGLVLARVRIKMQRKAKRNHPAPPILNDRVDDWGPDERRPQKGMWE